MKEIIKQAIHLLALFSVAFLLVPGLCSHAGDSDNSPKPAAGYWPTNGWQYSTPEAQGMDSGVLADMLAYVREEKINIDTITVVRNGYLLLDAYLHPLFKRGQRHIMHSCTKSVTSALMGIAIGQGIVKGVDQPVIDFFPEKKFAHMDDRKKAIRIEHLLTMSHGIRTLDSFLYGWQGLRKLWKNPDWVQFILDQPMDTMPGERYDYSNMSSYLLSAIIHKQTGAPALEFAKEHLFRPLGIRNVLWPPNSQGESRGWGEMWMTPQDMAKFGWLYLNHGVWDGQQVVPKQWVTASVQKRTFPRRWRSVLGENGQFLLGKTIIAWKVYNFGFPFSDGYGYQWWVGDSGRYSAIGYGGQYIMVIPDQRMVVVFTSVLSGNRFAAPEKLLRRYIIPSVVSDQEIPLVPPKYKRLIDQLAAARETPEPAPTVSLNRTTEQISGKTFRFESNKEKFVSIALIFEPDSKTATLHQVIGETSISAEIGLDNTYRINRLSKRRVALKGSWIDENRFKMHFDHIGYTTRGIVTITFNDKQLVYERRDSMLGKTELSARISP